MPFLAKTRARYDRYAAQRLSVLPTQNPIPECCARIVVAYICQVTKLFVERLQAWKHAVGYLEDYVTATEKTHHAHGKEYERVLKTVKDPLKEGHHFDQALGGIAGMFENIRSNTQVSVVFFGLPATHFPTIHPKTTPSRLLTHH